ncbi:efflux RND transporter periplasmic adaptor subunit [Natronogracilivirga saccharolytica]|uniref:Efflux RND transporter periplasmic adaptor subunit n=1 Tax=Natronogracilivirga saccharolytica TaxID=2812953 RepID=A0A8J7UU52_9BACT|nr:efflux RND transporter periplasmic adaptor subunit [Natronogracilivirga saccharolytica]MBP3191132.1 efflux RND transporter periplasmic adaptor subunit [Natronogracilivirga saccharolytica]
MKRFLISIAIIVAAAGIAAWVFSGDSSKNEQPDNSLKVEKGSLTSHALAVGQIEPRNEIEIKSKISGVVNRVYAEAGDYVREGDPLLEIRPDPTPLELAEAKRNVERSENALENLQREMFRTEKLRERDMVSDHDYQELQQRKRDAEIDLQLNRERLELLESGRIMIGETLIESVIKAPANGFILEKSVDIGDPIVPLTSYQAGTVLMSLACMEDLIFKGTVDEIDVGKMEEGMAADIRIGALPDAKVKGELSKISLKAVKRDNSTVFPVEIRITDPGGYNLRAGYSANANVIIDHREDVLTVPERIVTYNDDKTTVYVPGRGEGGREEREIRVGLSDAINVEVIEGLEEGETVLEKPVRNLASK